MDTADTMRLVHMLWLRFVLALPQQHAVAIVHPLAGAAAPKWPCHAHILGNWRHAHVFGCELGFPIVLQHDGVYSCCSTMMCSGDASMNLSLCIAVLQHDGMCEHVVPRMSSLCVVVLQHDGVSSCCSTMACIIATTRCVYSCYSTMLMSISAPVLQHGSVCVSVLERSCCITTV